ncbi:MAG TPA: asparaginase [Candidatus Eisenbacteria bacterium]
MARVASNMPETKAPVDRDVAVSARLAPLVHFLRGGHVESIHSGHVAVVDPRGKLLAWAGDPHALVFPRSAFKPFQALPLVESGAFARSGLGLDALALIAGSHGGTDSQVALVLRILEAAGADAEALQCGVHEPYDEPTAKALRARGEAPSPLRHNCSGKHAGMLLLARALGEPLEHYLDPAHPVQRLIFDRFAELMGAPIEDPVPAIDGCSAPTPRLPLSGLARAFALFARGVDAKGEPVPALVEIKDAMMAYPENVAGEGRLDTALMRCLKGALVSKAGAEGMHAAAYLTRGIGIAVKVADGSRRALKPAVLAVLDQLALVSEGDREILQPAEETVIRSYAGLVAGEIRPALELQRVSR